ncbi:MAG TPA: CvpA family protein [Terriglobales bacterium]|nr:CvpA family protein [Terriglobales bacterium]
MSVADWIIWAVILASVLLAIRNGFFREVFAIAGLVLGYLVAAWQYQHLAAWLETFLKSEVFSEVAAFLAVFLAVTVVAGLAGELAHWAMKKSGLSILDRILGGAVGVLRGCLIVAVVLMCMTAFSPASPWLQNSQVAPYFLVVGRAVIWLAPSELRARFYQGLDLLHHAGQTTQAPPGKK